jgi:hypothetical protein
VVAVVVEDIRKAVWWVGEWAEEEIGVVAVV